MADDWTDRENDQIVRCYFDMLRAELCGEDYNKSQFNRIIRNNLNDRTRGSVEYKNQNISAVLVGLGLPWIDGYKPASRFQSSLVEAVLRWLVQNPGWPENMSGDSAQKPRSVQESHSLWIGPPPTMRNERPLIDPDFMAQVARKFDVAQRDERNRALGQMGEQIVFQHEQDVLRNADRGDLAEKVRWISRDEGDGAGYDIYSFEADGKDRLLEVKTKNGWERTPFHISRKELAVANKNSEIWHLIRVWDFSRTPRAYAIRPPLEAYVSLTPTTFKASLL